MAKSDRERTPASDAEQRLDRQKTAKSPQKQGMAGSIKGLLRRGRKPKRDRVRVRRIGAGIGQYIAQKSHVAGKG